MKTTVLFMLWHLTLVSDRIITFVRWHHNTTKKHVTETKSSDKMYKFHMRAVEKVSAVSMNCVQVGGKETKDRKKIYTHELRLLFASDLPIGSILKMLSLNRMQLEDLNLHKKIHNYGAVELTVHISKGCVCFLFTPLYCTHESLPYAPKD